MKATIFLLDRMGQFDPTYKAAPIKNVSYTQEKKLVGHLKTLQAGYADCGRLKVSRGTHKSGRKYVSVENEADFFYCALIQNEPASN